MSTTTETAVRYERDADGIVTLTLDDPTASANTMNEPYSSRWQAAVDRLYDEAGPDVTGVVVTSAKKTFFAGGNLKSMVQATKDDAAADLRAGRGGQGRPAPPRDVPTPGRRRDQRRRARRRLRDLPGLPTTASPSTTARSRSASPRPRLGLLPGGGGVTRTCACSACSRR